jgi:hypothetical protein
MHATPMMGSAGRRRAVNVASLLLALLSPTLAAAQPATPTPTPPPPATEAEAEAQRILTEGVQLMDAGHLPEARAKFDHVRELMPDKPNPYRLLGVVDFRLNRCREAVAELEIFLGKVGPNDRRVTEVVSMRDRCKEELAPKVGELTVESRPPGAEIWLDDDSGAPVGVTPAKNDEVAVGAHVVFVRLKGFKPASQAIRVLVRGERVKVSFTLAREEPIGRAPKPLYKKGWFWGVMAGALVLAGGGVALGVYYGTRPAPFTTTLPPFQLGLMIK